MTARVIWTEPQQWWPEHRDFPTVNEAHRFALERVRAGCDDVGVHELGEGA